VVVAVLVRGERKEAHDGKWESEGEARSGEKLLLSEMGYGFNI